MILDASVAVALLIRHPLSEAARAIGPIEFAAPQALLAEVANTLWKYVMFADLARAEAADAIGYAGQICSFVPDETLVADALDIALANRHPVYDCLYLALARQRRERLVTGDRKLDALAQRLGIESTLLRPAA